MSRSEIQMGLMNLHDVFLNASLQRRSMDRCSVEQDVTFFHMSDRARFERVWVTFLYVLVEAWQSPPMEPVREHISSVMDVSSLNGVLAELNSAGDLAKMREVRDYMCHRDRREYWDTGRVAVAGMLSTHVALHDAFGDMLLKGLEPFTQPVDSE
ncbi:MAG: hypothetical protein OXH49_08410 [Gemmatimonadetes bacterium]|nr:hypothetical protein [Gemmatimonadota bacterium]